MKRAQKLAFGSCDFSISLVLTLVGIYFAIFLVNVVGMSAGAAAIAVFLGRSWDYVNDPLLGYLSDRTRSRWGRRRPFLLFGAVPFGVAFALMWWIPPIAKESWLVVYYAATYLLFDAAVTVVYMPFVSLTTDLTQDYDERTGLTNYRMAFSIIASLVAFAVPPMFIPGITSQYAPRFFLLGVVGGAVSIVPIVITFLGTREREEFVEESPAPFFASLKAAFRNRPFVFSMVIFLLTWVCVDLLLALILFFIQYVIVRGGQSEIIMGPIFVTALLALPLWFLVADKLDKRRALMIGLGFWAFAQLLLITLIPESSLANVLVMCVLAGIGVSAAHVLPWAMVPDAVEYDEWKTGKRHEGTFFSILTLAQKVASSLAVPGALLVLEAAGYVPGAPRQPAMVVTALRGLVGPVPALLLAGAIILAVFYPLGRDEFRRIVRELEERRSSGVTAGPAEKKAPESEIPRPEERKPGRRRWWIWTLSAVAALALVVLMGPRATRIPTPPAEGAMDFSEGVSRYVAEAESWFDDIEAGKEKTVQWAGSPEAKTDISVVFLHGFSGSRRVMEPVPQLVASELGANLFLTRYAGHGRGEEQMSIASVRSWSDDTAEAIRIGRELGDFVVVMALSTAAPLVASLDAQDLDADAVIFLSPNFGPADEAAELLLLPWGNLIARFVVGRWMQFQTVSNAHTAATTSRFRSGALVTMMSTVRLGSEKTMSRMSAPVLFLYSERDEVVSVDKIRAAFEAAGSRVKDLQQVVGASGHVLGGDILSPGSTAEVVDKVVRFVRSLAP